MVRAHIPSARPQYWLKNCCKRPGESGARWLICLAACAALAVAGCSGGTATKPPPSAVPGPYTVRGNEILGPDGKPFVPYGITIPGLSEPDWQPDVASDVAQIEATARFWHGNTVRLQVAPTDLLDTYPYNKPYLAAIRKEVAAAQDNGLDVILSAQYENTTNLPMPDASTARFWQLIAPRYKGDPGVWFDLFNEPAFVPGPANQQLVWRIWQYGGYGYVGMQHLVKVIRATGARNVILAEGLEKALTLSGLPAHLLTGGNIAYAVHPYFNGTYWSKPQAWEANWGNLTGTVPVVADEWGEFEHAGGECVHKAPTLVPAFLRYLSGHHVGLIAWALVPGVLIRGSNLYDPTAFPPGVTTWKCEATDPGQEAQGPGQVVRAYFAAHSAPVS
jgi:endoglucanase